MSDYTRYSEVPTLPKRFSSSADLYAATEPSSSTPEPSIAPLRSSPHSGQHGDDEDEEHNWRVSYGDFRKKTRPDSQRQSTLPGSLAS